jgi:NifU-like protein involved in Fe-S cluster formation
MMTAAVQPALNTKVSLYTPELLMLAVSLADYPLSLSHHHRAEVRSRICGSVVAVSMNLDEDNRVTAVGMRVSACAVGQAAAALFARGGAGHNAASLEEARREIADWLSGEGTLPGWPALHTLSAALPHSGRHSAILLPWDAALRALSNAPKAD